MQVIADRRPKIARLIADIGPADRPLDLCRQVKHAAHFVVAAVGAATIVVVAVVVDIVYRIAKSVCDLIDLVLTPRTVHAAAVEVSIKLTSEFARAALQIADHRTLVAVTAVTIAAVASVRVVVTAVTSVRVVWIILSRGNGWQAQHEQGKSRKYYQIFYLVHCFLQFRKLQGNVVAIARYGKWQTVCQKVDIFITSLFTMDCNNK